MRNSLFFLISLLFFAACNSTTKMTEGPLTLSSEKPQPGHPINLQYQADSSKLAGKEDLKGTLYYAVQHKLYAEAIALTDSGKAWHGTFTLPDSAQAFALKFSSGDLSDENNGKGYVFPVYDKSGNRISGALAATSNFYNGMGSYLLGIKSNPDTALTLLQQDMTANPAIKKDWQDNYLFALLAVKKDSAYSEIQQQVSTILSGDSATEKDYTTAYNLYRQMKMMPQADSLKTVIEQKYPNGNMAQGDLAQAFSKQQNVDSMVLLYNQFKQQYPTTDPQSSTANIESFMLSRIANAYAAKKQYDNVMQYASQSSSKMLQANTYNSVAWGLAEKGEDLAIADSLSKASLDALQYEIDHLNENKPAYYTAEDWKQNLQGSYGNNADTYAMILSKEGKDQDALQYQKKAVEFTKGKTPDINERYVAYLTKTGDYATALTEAEKFITDGKSTPKMLDYLKTAYTGQHHSDSGYTTYMAGLEAKAEAKIKADLAQKMIDKPATVFDLPDLKGNNISLASLKGKVVIVDFWATWCGPCKASFPGMQKAVTHFKEDSNVVFLFVNTWENTKPDVRQKQVSDFIAQHDYSFHVLMDQRQAKDSTQFQVVSDFGVDGIPTKFIIDPKGDIRFKLVGFDGNTDQEAKEIAMMVDMLKS